jgi:hypothetical protein
MDSTHISAAGITAESDIALVRSLMSGLAAGAVKG